MSPAKRLSRQRFRALCERCAKWGRSRTAYRQRLRVTRFYMHTVDSGVGDFDARIMAARRYVDALARIAR